jgi:hypothetical protein
MDGMPTTLSVGFLLTEYATPSASQDRTGSCGRHSPCWGGPGGAAVTGPEDGSPVNRADRLNSAIARRFGRPGPPGSNWLIPDQQAADE